MPNYKVNMKSTLVLLAIRIVCIRYKCIGMDINGGGLEA